MISINRPGLLHTLKIVQSVQAFFPPGLAGDAVAMASKGRHLAAGAFLCEVAFYAVVAGGLLALRLRAEFRGESLGDAPTQARAKPAGGHGGLRWDAQALQPQREAGSTGLAARSWLRNSTISRAAA